MHDRFGPKYTKIESLMGNTKFKILLLSVNSTTFFYEQLVVPFGLISIGSYVDNSDYEIQGIEMNYPPNKIMERYLKTDDNLLKQILDFQPDVVAMSTYASNMYNVMFYANVIKKYIANSFVIVGGNQASYIAKECLDKCKGIDAVVRFEGEIPFKMICERLHKKDYDLSDIPSITYRLNNEIVENAQAGLMNDLNSLPLLNRTYFKGQQSPDKVTHADVIGSRGCPHNCTFCNCNHYWSKKYRSRSVELVIEEIKELIQLYPNLESIRIRDDSLTLSKKHCLEVCEEIISQNIKLRFQAHSRLDGLDEEVIRALSKSGFEILFIGVESASKKVLERVKKGINIEKLENIISLLKDHGIAYRLSFMSATPGENFFMTMETVRLIKRLNLKKGEYYMGYGIDIYPGTKECELFLEKNPDYEWITKEYAFKGNYSITKDNEGNIIVPKYKEYGICIAALFFLILSPAYFLQQTKRKAKIFFKSLFGI